MFQWTFYLRVKKERERKRVHFINLSNRLEINNLIQIKEIS